MRFITTTIEIISMMVWMDAIMRINLQPHLKKQSLLKYFFFKSSLKRMNLILYNERYYKYQIVAIIETKSLVK